MEPTSLPQFKDVRWRWIAYATSFFLAVAIVFAFFHEVELKQDVQCEIVSPSEVKIQGLRGLVSSISIRPSSRVDAGAPLFRLQRDLSLSSDGTPRPVFDEQMRDDQLNSAEEQYRQQKAQLDASLDASRLELASREGEVAALDGQIAQMRQLVSESEQTFARLQSVSDYITVDRIEQASAQTHQAKVNVAQGAARRQELVGQIGSLRGTQASLQAQLSELDARHARDLQDIKVRFEQGRQDVTIFAPKSGTVTFSNLVAGRTLEEGDVAVVIATDGVGSLRAALRIPSRRRGFVHAGQVIRLKFDAFPYAKFGTYEARIDSISGTTVGSGMTSQAASAPNDGEGDYMAWATLRGKTFDYGRQHFAILPGMRATASIVVERRTIAEWVLEPLFRILRG